MAMKDSNGSPAAIPTQTDALWRRRPRVAAVGAPRRAGGRQDVQEDVRGRRRPRLHLRLGQEERLQPEGTIASLKKSPLRNQSCHTVMIGYGDTFW